VSEENVELVRSAFDAWNSGDMEGVIERCDPEVEFHPLRAQLEGAPYRGAEGMRQFARDMLEEWEFLRVLTDELRDCGERVLVLGHFDAKGRASGMDLRFPVGWVARVREGRIRELRTYSSQDDALAAVS
jgi:ketosteroid isomerase-like protein